MLFATNPFLNEVDVLSGQNLAVTARVNVPQPVGIDQMPDGNTLVVGTLTQGIYTINENTLAVTQYLAPNLSNVGLSTTVLPIPVAMANGNVLLLGQDVGIYIGNDDYAGQYIVEWNSNTGVFSLDMYTSPTIYDLKRSSDHQWATFGVGDELYIYSSNSDSLTSGRVAAVAGYGIGGVAVNPNGTQFAVASGASVSFYDSAFRALGTFNTVSTLGLNFSNVQYSSDGSVLYWELYGQTGGGSVVNLVDTSTFQDLGNVTTAFALLEDTPDLLWVDNTQRAFESAEGGVGIFDCSALRTGLPTATGTLPNPKSIPLNTTPPVSFVYTEEGTLPLGSVVTFGGQPAIAESLNPLVVEAPASSLAGPVNLVVTQPDGETELEPQEFSYGVNVAAATASLLPPTGNPTMGLFGFGLLNSDSSPPTGPTSVTVGGVPASNAAIDLEAVNALEEVEVQVPNGNPGPADITVTGNNGSGVLGGAVTFITSVRVLPASGLLQLIYDNGRNLVYALQSTQVGVLDPTTLQWQAPLLPGTGKSYVSMALTPNDDSMLLVDSTANTLTIFDPDNPTTESIAALPAQLSPYGRVVTSSTGEAFVSNGLGRPVEFDLTTSTATLLPLNLSSNTFAATPDGSQMVAAILGITSGQIGVWNSSNDSFAFQSFQDGLWTDLAISPDGSTFAAVEGIPGQAGVLAYLFDEQLHYLNEVVYPDLAPPDTPQNLGTMFSPSGLTLIIPLGDSIDFFSSSTGKLQGRLLTPEALPVLNFPITSTGTIALDPTTKIIYAISASGLTVMTLPTPVDQMVPPVWPYVIGSRHLGTSKTANKIRAVYAR